MLKLMKHAIFFPLYNIYSDLVKTAMGLKDNRSVEQFFKEAGIQIHEIGKKKCIRCEDLLNIVKNGMTIIEYKAQSKLSKRIENLE
jgi:hypothetical protein